MKGTNELLLNQATMIEAVQLWLDATLAAKGPVVTKVERDTSSYSGRDFKITIDAADGNKPGQ
jgi:hypothetical protein